MSADNNEQAQQQMDVDQEVETKAASSIVNKVYVPGMSRSLKRSEELVYDPKAYLLLHTFETNYPCLSFDVIPDSLGENRQNFPMTAWLASGTQAEKTRSNELLVMRLSNMRPNKKALEAKRKEEQRNRRPHDEDANESSSSDESSSDEEEGDEAAMLAKAPKMHAALIPHYGGVNRIKCQRLGPSDVCAVWNDQSKVQIWHLNPCIEAVEKIQLEAPSRWQKMDKEKPLFSYPGHGTEGFALAWSSLKEGSLASGDVHHKIFLWRMAEGGQWLIDQRALTDHHGSVEDLAWSPTDEALLLSCSTDGTIRLWDVRSPAKQACVSSIPSAHESSDVNVIGWNAAEPLILSGGDDGALRVWSMRTIQYKERQQPVAQFLHHKKPITSVEWNPQESTMFMASGEDDQTTIWDLALEEETPTNDMEEQNEEEKEGKGDEQGNEKKLPPQLLFIHMGQKEVKEVHWHRQCPGMAFTTALDGFHAFKTINS